MLKTRTTVIVSLILSFFATEAFTYFLPGSPNCPWANPKNTWAKYLNREYGDPNPFFSIHFTRHISELEAGQCYTIKYLGSENWSGSGKIRSINPHTSQMATTHGGDPAKSEINVWGARFTYNEGGELFYAADGKLAGNMYCHFGSECWK